MKINAKGLHYRKLNELIQDAINSGKSSIYLENVNGQRYIAAGLEGDNIEITIDGIPGNDLAAFMDGPTVVVNSSAQDGTGNTMSGGKIIVHGSAGDIVGHSMRGGKIYVKGDVGYRVGIHMKAYRSFYPVIIVGGTARDFLGEYMAGGLIIVLGTGSSAGEPVVGNYCGTGMHGGKMYVRADLEDYRLGKEVKKLGLEDDDNKILSEYLKEYCECFSLNPGEIMKGNFVKLLPSTHRPYGKLYA